LTGLRLDVHRQQAFVVMGPCVRRDDIEVLT
jgi:hypothetical protein